jgi:hypothetical protein
MYVVTGEKSCLWTDYCPTRKYFVVKFTDGNGKEWYQLAYRWGWWTYYLRRLRVYFSGSVGGSPMTFDSLDEANLHLEKERAWLERETRSKQIFTKIVETNHDAAPAAIARTESAAGEPGGGCGSGGTDKPVTQPAVGAGNTFSQPVAWMAVAIDGSESSAVYAIEEQAMAAATEWGWQVVPLYPFPALWPEDEIAIEAAWERTGLKPTWPADEPMTGVRCANAMADEIELLRGYRDEAEAQAALANLMVDRLRLTAEERKAVDRAIGWCDDQDTKTITTLRGLLERLG